MIDMARGHYGIVLETKKRKDSSILFLEDDEEDLCLFKAIRKVHEVNRHKGKEQLMTAYQNTGWMSPYMANVINRIINDCKVCQKFQRLVAGPRVSLPRATSFNKVVTLDLKEFGSKYLPWMINAFSRFIVGKLIMNKRVDTIFQVLTNSWCMSLGFPSHGFFADNG